MPLHGPPGDPHNQRRNPLSYLTTPLVSQEAIQGLQDTLDTPEEGRSPMEAQLRGFGAGALEGLRELSSPLSMAGMVLPAAKGVGHAAGVIKAARGLPKRVPGMLPPSADAGAKASESLDLAFGGNQFQPWEGLRKVGRFLGVGE